MFFSTRNGSSFIVPLIFKDTLFFYPSYSFFEIFPSYSNYFFASQADLNLSTQYFDEPEILISLKATFIPTQSMCKDAILSFVSVYSKLSFLYLYKETIILENGEALSDSLFSVFNSFSFLTDIEEEEEEALNTLLETNYTLSNFSSSLLALSSLSCYEGSSIRNSILANIKDYNLSSSLNVSTHFFFNEAFSKDLYLSPDSYFISGASSLVQLYAVLADYDFFLFKESSTLFYYYCS